jgi:hypothetical protein
MRICGCIKPPMTPPPCLHLPFDSPTRNFHQHGGCWGWLCSKIRCFVKSKRFWKRAKSITASLCPKQEATHPLVSQARGTSKSVVQHPNIGCPETPTAVPGGDILARLCPKVYTNQLFSKARGASNSHRFKNILKASTSFFTSSATLAPYPFFGRRDIRDKILWIVLMPVGTNPYRESSLNA